uniref:Uncharacterized protein n=1 Tax=Stomoxys calcitrans TaxID=35570 RepID=A0A1I8NMU4_STOCA
MAGAQPTERQADFLRPWLATNIVMVIMCIVMLVMTNDVMQIILGTMVLLFQGISWYPIYKLYHRYYDEGKARDEEHSSSDNFLMTNGGLESTAAPYYADIDAYPMRFHYEEPPPTYEQVMGIESQPPSFSDLHNCAGT